MKSSIPLLFNSYRDHVRYYVSFIIGVLFFVNNGNCQFRIISQADTVIDLNNETLSYIDEHRSILAKPHLDEAKFEPLSKIKYKRFYNQVRFCQWLKIQLNNPSNTNIPIQLYVGKFALLKLFKYNDTLQYLASAGFTDYTSSTNKINPNYGIKILLNSNESITYYLQIEHYGKISETPKPKIFISSAYNDWVQKEDLNKKGIVLFHSLVLGGIFTLALFMLIYFFSNNISEYLFYALYSFTIFLFLERSFELNSNIKLISQLYPYYFYQMPTVLNLIAAIFYVLFIQNFTDIKIKYPRIYKLSNDFLKIIYALLAVFSCLLLIDFSSRWFIIMNFILNFIPPLGMLILVLIIYTKDRKNKLNNFIFIGFSFLFISVIISIILNNFTEWSTFSVPPATYLEVGVLCEILCLAFGLGYKSNRIEKLKNETEILNLQLKIENITNIERLRSELSRDLHDDIGSTLSSINILSRTTRNNLQTGNIEKVNIALEKINERSQRLLEKMSDIIWNIKPDNDSLVATMSRMREYSTTLLDAQNVHYNFDFPPENDDFSISLKVKSTLYLIFKEAVNNLIKYAHCSHVKLTLKITHQSLYLTIEDNGIGFDIDQITHQGGLLNMQHRAEEVNGTLYISSQLDQGTKIELSIPLTPN